MYEKGQKLRLKRGVWGHKPGTVGKIVKTTEPTPVNKYSAQLKLKGSPRMSVSDADLDDLLEPVPESMKPPIEEGRHKPGCQCGFCKNMGRGFAKKTEQPAEPAEPAEETPDAGEDAKMESWLPAPPDPAKPLARSGLSAGQIKRALLHDEFPVQEARTRCECSDPGCPHCHGKCDKRATTNLRRIDMVDETGTMMCHACASDALDSGVFREDIGAKIKYR
jgi:hypothetical protein